MGKEQEFIQAAKNGDVAFVRKQVSKFRSARAKKSNKKFNVNQKDIDGFTALHHAALQGNVEIIIGLLEMEGDPNIRDLKGMCPLHLAAWGGKVEPAKLLIDAGAEVNSCCRKMQTPLHMASEHGHHVVAEVLLDHGADPSLLNENSRTSLDLACQFGHSKVVDLLIKSENAGRLLGSSSKKEKTHSPLHLAAKHGHVAVVRMLLEAGADINLIGENGTCLHEAALYGKTDVVRLLLEAGVNVSDRNTDNMTALDIVNKFTSSSASSEIKRLLKEAEGNEVLFGRAIADYCNVYDPKSLSFHCGDMIMVLDKSEDGRWKGSIKDGQRERVGFFPSTAIRVMSRQACQAAVRKQASLKTPPKQQGLHQVQASIEVVPVKTLGSTSPPPLRPNKSRVSSFTHRLPPSSPPPPPPPDELEDAPHLRHYTMPSKSPSSNGTESPPSPSQKHIAKIGFRLPIGEVPLPGQHLKSTPPQQQPKDEEPLKYAEVIVSSSNAPRLVGTGGNAQKYQKTQYADVVLPSQRKLDLESENEKKAPTKPSLPPLVEPQQLWQQQKQLSHVSEQNKKKPLASKETVINEQIQEFPRTSSLSSSITSTKPGIKTPEKRRKTRDKDSYEDMSGGSPVKSVPSSLESHFKESTGVSQKSNAPVYDIVTTKQNLAAPVSKENKRPMYMNLEQLGTKKSLSLQKSPCYENMAETKGKEANEGKESTLTFEKRLYPGYELVKLKKSTNTPDEQRKKDDGRLSPSFDYVTMERKPRRETPDGYVSMTREAPDGSGGPSFVPDVNTGLKMREYNALFDWLAEYKLQGYIEPIIRGGFDLISLQAVTAEDLTAINIVKAGHRKKLLSEACKIDIGQAIPDYKPADVPTWLKVIGMDNYVTIFMDGGFDDIDFIKDMTEDDLETIGIKKPGHKRKLLMAIEKLEYLENQGSGKSALLPKVHPATTDRPVTPPPSFLPPPPPNLNKTSKISSSDIDSDDAESIELPPPPPPLTGDLNLDLELPPPPLPSYSFHKSNEDLPPPPTLTSAGQSGSPKKAPPPIKPKSFKKPVPDVFPKPTRTMSDSFGDRLTLFKQTEDESGTALSPRSYSHSQPSSPDTRGVKKTPPAPPKRTCSEITTKPEEKPVSQPGKKQAPQKPPRRNSNSSSGSSSPLQSPRLSPTPMTFPSPDESSARLRLPSEPLDEQIKNVFRRGSSKGTLDPYIPASLPSTDQDKTEMTQDEVADVTDELMKDINSMIADFDLELDSMFQK